MLKLKFFIIFDFRKNNVSCNSYRTHKIKIHKSSSNSSTGSGKNSFISLRNTEDLADFQIFYWRIFQNFKILFGHASFLIFRFHKLASIDPFILSTIIWFKQTKRQAIYNFFTGSPEHRRTPSPLRKEVHQEHSYLPKELPDPYAHMPNPAFILSRRDSIDAVIQAELAADRDSEDDIGPEIYYARQNLQNYAPKITREFMTAPQQLIQAPAPPVKSQVSYSYSNVTANNSNMAAHNSNMAAHNSNMAVHNSNMAVNTSTIHLPETALVPECKQQTTTGNIISQMLQNKIKVILET